MTLWGWNPLPRVPPRGCRGLPSWGPPPRVFRISFAPHARQDKSRDSSCEREDWTEPMKSLSTYLSLSLPLSRAHTHTLSLSSYFILAFLRYFILFKPLGSVLLPKPGPFRRLNDSWTPFWFHPKNLRIRVRRTNKDPAKFQRLIIRSKKLSEGSRVRFFGGSQGKKRKQEKLLLYWIDPYPIPGQCKS